jgi:hypothetical protein
MTIPYRLSPAELENLRLLRERMKPAGSIPHSEEQENISKKNDGQRSKPDRSNHNLLVEKGN